MRSAIPHADDTVTLGHEGAELTLNAIGDAVVCTDTSSEVTFRNTVAAHLTGWSTREARRAQPFADVCRLVDGLTRLPAESHGAGGVARQDGEPDPTACWCEPA